MTSLAVEDDSRAHGHLCDIILRGDTGPVARKQCDLTSTGRRAPRASRWTLTIGVPARSDATGRRPQRPLYRATSFFPVAL